MDWTEARKRINELPSCPAGIKKDFIVRRSITEIEGKPHVETYSESELIKCKDCKNGSMDSASYPYFWCSKHSEYHKGEYFCADGEYQE